MIPVILSGGVGSRLWPLSRGMYPKQLLPLVDPELTMLQQTVRRAADAGLTEPPLVICNHQHRFMVAEQLLQASPSTTIILEPEGRNTAPAIALAALRAQQGGEDPLLLVMPADHVIADVEKFSAALEAARELAEQDRLVTFGVVPNGPETGYGYIKAGRALGDSGFSVAEFKEKPELDKAKEYIAAGNYYWNGGIFMFRTSTYLHELQKYQPEVYGACRQAVLGAHRDLDFLRLDDEAFCRSPSISIDYAVMETTDLAAVVPLDVGWNDVGSWSALWDVSQKDMNGNSIHGDVLIDDTANSHIYAESTLVATVGVENLVVVQTADAVLVADKGSAQNVKNIVELLKTVNRTQKDHHRKVYRPWGWYDSIDIGSNFQVKRIQVNPGAKLSVQMHNHRAEHWVVVEGVAEVLNGDQTSLLNENESTYIPIGTKHALRNPSETEFLEIIEVQSGSYLGEDDIVRFEDDYGRAGTTE